MKGLMAVLGFVAAALLLSGCAPGAPAGAPAAKKALLMGSTSTTSSVYLYYVAVGKVVNSKVPEVNVTVVETGATVENIKRMGKGELDLGLTTEDQAYQAFNGIDRWKDELVKELRLLWLQWALPCPPIVREDSGVKRMEDLDGKDFNPGMRGSATEANTKAYLEVLGIKPKWYVGGLEDALAATKDRRIVGFAKCLAGFNIPDASMLDLQIITPIRILGLTPEHTKKIQEKYPWFSIVNVEAGVYKADWNKEPIATVGVLGGTSATTRVAEDMAYKITKAIVEDNKPGGEGVQATAFPGVKGTDFAKLTIESSDTFIHTGALKYYKELGLKIKDSHIPPEAKR